jgi:RecA/RadA recombinase
VWGEASTGKTSLMIQTAVQAAIRSKKTLFVDADRSFTPQRLTQIAGSESRSLGEYITLFLPENFAHQTSLIEDLESYMSPRVGLVIFDTITSLYRAALRGDQKPFALNRELTRQLAYLEEFAAAHRIAVVLTSQVHARLKPGLSEIEPVARRTLFHFPRTILRISHTPEASVKTIILERVRGEQARSEVTVRLNQSGFCPIRTHGE